ncbi:winged helix-turn-helix domain-containing protein [Homoserinibacter sp. YIM 151385]|uniref:winged helix-turn-helix domain-containing protein n=1 Tax=Homoserinibacter sp. YIM 151385 TaxID=2985506 RepID=UPI0022F0ED9F|nr:crosslink repair DNA glycosylase YcaQ family protein [Homoserinibacter sp. YIM 151385]WBU38059.1 winged helix DNA-binding domain-containing protein [Homoserinibacter sp. YIM 151385]
MVEKLSLARARRLALGAQGFARPRPASVGTRQLALGIDRLRLLQLDSVNVFERSHYLPLLARLGPYDTAALDALTFERTGSRARYFEFWGHEAALMPLELLPEMRWKMQRLRERDDARDQLWARDPANARMMQWVRAHIAEHGPMAASEIEHEENRRTGPWWGWSDVKMALEVLFRWGELVSAGRRRFERRYGLPEQVLPAGAFDAPVPSAEDATRSLVRQAVVAHGVGTVGHLADYFRLRIDRTTQALQELVEEGAVLPVQVEGWARPAFMDAGAVIPRRIETAALLSPFDPVVWERDRALRLFGFHYRIEIYTPPPKRVFGYYTLPVLVDDRVVGRIDLKRDRKAGALRVQSAWWEHAVPPGLEERVAPALREAAAWQGLDDIRVFDWGTAAADLARALGVPLEPSDAPTAGDRSAAMDVLEGRVTAPPTGAARL